MSILSAGIRMGASLVGDQLRRGLIGRDLFASAANLADAPGESWAVLTTDPQGDPRTADIVLRAQTARVARLAVAPARIAAETAVSITIGV